MPLKLLDSHFNITKDQQMSLLSEYNAIKKYSIHIGGGVNTVGFVNAMVASAKAAARKLQPICSGGDDWVTVRSLDQAVTILNDFTKSAEAAEKLGFTIRIIKCKQDVVDNTVVSAFKISVDAKSAIGMNDSFGHFLDEYAR